jgi:hydrogenase maturation protein HypF
MEHLWRRDGGAGRRRRGIQHARSDPLHPHPQHVTGGPGERREGRSVRVRGLVQGVGFRPAVWRLAQECGIAGEVWNDAQGVMIQAWGAPAALDDFVDSLREGAPPLARVDTIDCAPLSNLPPVSDFRITASRAGAAQTGVVPDAATCGLCLAETQSAADRRHRYPFTNCTHCGPRFSIVQSIPYDRANTSMSRFALCVDCQREYDDPTDRRFHAQPLACSACGPVMWLEPLGDAIACATVDAVGTAAGLLLEGAIVAVKGIGGFHLACDACNADAVEQLRTRKRRYDKPFALMARDMDIVRQYCAAGPQDEVLLRSPAAPIVVMPAEGRERVAMAVAPGQRTLGFMLPYTPLHHLLLESIERPIVLTSGNLSEEPQCTANDEARRKLATIADYGLFHDRDIVNRIDDSVTRVLSGERRVLRRARGYAPAPLALPEGFAVSPPVLAVGGELKNTFCLVKNGQAILSQHMGDLEDAATFAEYRRSLALYRELFDHMPDILAVDRHPQYLSTRLGEEWAARDGLALEQVQHHHAHIASCMAEHGLPLGAPPVFGIALDGLGYGEDDTFWGGEFLLADYLGFTRVGRLKPVAMPGGAQAVREPWRNTFAHLDTALGWERCMGDFPQVEVVLFLQTRPLAPLRAMIRNNVNSPPASSCGRLFDAVAAALGICRERASYEGQAAIELEASVDEHLLENEAGYSFAIDLAPTPAAPVTLDSRPMWEALLRDLADHTPAPVVAARFHRGLAGAVVKMAAQLVNGAETAVLSGGVFQNRVLLELVTEGLQGRGFRVLSPRQVPANDGGLSLGQAAIAAARQIARDNPAQRQAGSCV